MTDILFHSNEGLQFLDMIEYPEIKIAKSSFTFLAGKSGSGKSTYLRMLNRTVMQSAGSIHYRGKDHREYPVLAYRRSVLLVPQEVFLFEGSIKTNFEIFHQARESDIPHDAEKQKFLNICCLDFPLDTDCRNLSGGERQRVFLAIYLSCIPEVLLLDEPTAALDENTATALLQNIKDFCKQEQITVICICHNDELIEKFSEHTVRLGE